MYHFMHVANYFKTVLFNLRKKQDPKAKVRNSVKTATLLIIKLTEYS